MDFQRRGHNEQQGCPCIRLQYATRHRVGGILRHILKIFDPARPVCNAMNATVHFFVSIIYCMSGKNRSTTRNICLVDVPISGNKQKVDLRVKMNG